MVVAFSHLEYREVVRSKSRKRISLGIVGTGKEGYRRGLSQGGLLTKNSMVIWD